MSFTRHNKFAPRDGLRAASFFQHADDAWFAGLWDSRGFVALRKGRVGLAIRGIPTWAAKECQRINAGYWHEKKPGIAYWYCNANKVYETVQKLLMWSRSDGSELLDILVAVNAIGLIEDNHHLIEASSDDERGDG